MAARHLLAASASFVFAACGGQSEAPAPDRTELGYSMPAANPVTYVAADTAEIDIHLAPGQTMEQTMGRSSTVRMTFAPIVGTPGNLSVTATYDDFSGYMESSMMPRQDVSETITGEFELSLTPEGEVELLSGPELPPAVAEMSMGENMFNDFFMRLPATPVAPGMTWTDTIRTESSTEEARTTNESVIVSTFRGDTTVAGRALWIIESTRTSSVVVSGQMQGMDMRNEMSGSMAEVSLWDPARRLLHSQRATGEMTGTLSIPAAGMDDIPLEVTNRRYVRLVEGGS